MGSGDDFVGLSEGSRIRGDVLGGLGDDTLELTGVNSAIEGSADLGDGDNVLRLRRGARLGVYEGGAGGDAIDLEDSGTIDTVRLGSGSDRISVGADATVTELLLGGESGDVDAAEVLGGVGTIVGGKGEVRLLGFGSARFGTIDLRDSSPSVEGGLASRAILVAR